MTFGLFGLHRQPVQRVTDASFLVGRLQGSFAVRLEHGLACQHPYSRLNFEMIRGKLRFFEDGSQIGSVL